MPRMLAFVTGTICVLEKFFKVALFFLGLGLIFDVILQIVGRYFATPIFWTEEVSRFLFRYIVAFGAPLAVRSKEFVSVDALTQRLPLHRAQTLAIILKLMIAAFLLLVSYQAISFVRIGWIMSSPVLDIPMSFGYAAVFCASLFTGIMMILGALESILGAEAVQP